MKLRNIALGLVTALVLISGFSITKLRAESNDKGDINLFTSIIHEEDLT